MVGVPRSKGCEVCITRKIKCDMGKPSCAHCIKSKHDCPGYNRDRIFVHFSADGEKPSATYHPPRKTATPALDVVRRAKLDARMWNKVDVLLPGRSKTSSNLLTRPFFESPDVFRNQLMRMFLSEFFPKYDSWRQDYGLSWMRHLLESGRMSESLSTALTAACTVMIGRSHNDDDMISRSSVLYGRALNSLRKAVSNPLTAHSVDVLGATMALSNYELMRPNNDNNIRGWVTHTKGAASILQNWEFGREQTVLERALLNHVKTNCIFDAMSRRNSTFMAQDQWRQKLMGDDLHDSLRVIIVEIPTLLEQSDKITRTVEDAGSISTKLCQDILIRCQALEQRLAFWEDRAWTERPNLYWTSPTLGPRIKQEQKNNPYLFEEPFYFPSLPTAQIMTSYWSSRALVQDTMEQVLRALQGPLTLDHGAGQQGTKHQEYGAVRPVSTRYLSVDSEGLSNPFSIKSCRNGAITYANLVCRSVEFCIHPDHQHMGIQATSQPLWLAQQIFRGRDAMKSEWCLRASKTIAARGLGMMERISLDFGFEDYADSAKVGVLPSVDIRENQEIEIAIKLDPVVLYDGGPRSGPD